MILDGAYLQVWNLGRCKAKLEIPAAGAGCPATTDALPEGVVNLYYTSARFNAAFASKTTTDLAEGANLYYTQARFDTAFAAKTTANLAELTNLYFTNARARLALSVAAAPLAYDNTTGIFSLPAAASGQAGYLTAADWAAFTAKESVLTFNSPLSRTANAISIANAAADGATKGAAAFTASDFDAAAGVVSIDYTNGQAASAGAKGFLTSADWTTFNAKESALTFTAPLVRTVNTIAPDFTATTWIWTANNIATTPTDRIQLSNTQAAISGTQQYSPAIRFTGQGFDSTAGTSKATDFRIYNQPVQTAGNPTAILLIDFSSSGGAFATQYSFSSSGLLTTQGGVNSNGNIVSTVRLAAGTASTVGWSSSSRMSAPADGRVLLQNAAQTDFTRLQFGLTTSAAPALVRSSTTLKCRLADDSADAAFTALSFQSAAPTTGTSGVWKLGSKVAATVALNTAAYLEVDVGGVLLKLGLVT